MTAQELLVHLTQRQQKSFIEAIQAFPADKLDWKPAPGARSALNQIQEVATIPEFEGTDYEKRCLGFDEESWGRYQAERDKLTTVDELVQHLQGVTERMIARIQATPDEDLGLPFEMPWPVEFTVVDILSYHQWNMAYHEAQINYLASMLETPATG